LGRESAHFPPKSDHNLLQDSEAQVMEKQKKPETHRTRCTGPWAMPRSLGLTLRIMELSGFRQRGTSAHDTAGMCPALQMGSLGHSGQECVPSCRSSQANTGSISRDSTPSAHWECCEVTRTGRVTHTGYCCLCWVTSLLLRPGPHTRCPSPTSEARHTLLPERKPQAMLWRPTY
jgi:hypothetical protein